ESLLRRGHIIAAPMNKPQCGMSRCRLRIQIKRGFEFTLCTRHIVSPQIQGPERQMVGGTILIAFAQALDALLRFLDIVRAERGVGQKRQRLLVSRLLLENARSRLARLCKVTEGKKSQAKLDLYLEIVRLQLRRLLEQRICLTE